MKEIKNKMLGYTIAMIIEVIKTPNVTLTCLNNFYIPSDGFSPTLSQDLKIQRRKGGRLIGTAIMTVKLTKILPKTIAQSLST